MINDGINDVPDKTIAIFTDQRHAELTKEKTLDLVQRNSKKRDWFTPHFYRCLPLSIGNQYGFSVLSGFDFSFEWNGGEDNSDIVVSVDNEVIEADKKGKNLFYPNISSHFGSGILTVSVPLVFRTPPGVNLMTINPPNHIIPNITVMTGVIETDNLRFTFTFNLKIQISNIKVFVPKGTPLASFIPIPRYFSDSFDLKFADDLFETSVIEEELAALKEGQRHRKEVEPKLKDRVNKKYMMGMDIYGNKFKDHQRP